MTQMFNIIPNTNKLSKLIIDNDKYGSLLEVVINPSGLNVKHYTRNCMEWTYDPKTWYRMMEESKLKFNPEAVRFLETIETHCLIAYCATCDEYQAGTNYDTSGINCDVVYFLKTRQGHEQKHRYECSLYREYSKYKGKNSLEAELYYHDLPRNIEYKNYKSRITILNILLMRSPSDLDFGDINRYLFISYSQQSPHEEILNYLYSHLTPKHKALFKKVLAKNPRTYEIREYKLVKAYFDKYGY